jgi:hypothetical protein
MDSEGGVSAADMDPRCHKAALHSWGGRGYNISGYCGKDGTWAGLIKCPGNVFLVLWILLIIILRH